MGRSESWCVVLVAGVVLASAIAVHAAPTDKQKCERAKLKAHGKAVLCLQKNRADLLIGKPDDEATCRGKFQAAVAKADAKAAEALTACRFLDNGDSTISDLNTGLMWEKKTDDVFDMRDYRGALRMERNRHAS